MASFYRQFAYVGLSAPVPGGFVYITEVTAVILLVYIGRSVLIASFVRNNSYPRLQNIYWAYILFSFISLMTLLSSNWELPAQTIRDFATFYYSLFIFVPIVLFRREDNLDVLFRTIALATLFAYLLIVLRTLQSAGFETSTGISRYGNYETIGIVILTSLLMIKPMRKWTIAYWFGYIISWVLVVFVINHRSAFISLFCANLTMFFLCNKDVFKKMPKVLLIGTAIVVPLLSIAMVIDIDLVHGSLSRLATTFSPRSEPNAAWRLLVWQIALDDMAALDFLIGKGWGYSLPIFEFSDITYGVGEYATGFHNSILFIFYHIGSLGLMAFLSIMGGAYFRARRVARIVSLEKRRKLFALVASNIGIFIFAFFNVVLEGPYMSYFFWLTLGGIIAYSNVYILEQQHAPRS